MRYSRPGSLVELVALIKTTNAPCTCPKHQPLLYNFDHEHRTLERNYDTRYGGPLVGQTYESLKLAEVAVNFINRDEEFFDVEQKEALRELRELFAGKDSVLERLGAVFPDHVIRNAEVEGILEIFNRVFFFGALRLRFEWTHDLSDYAECDWDGDTSLIRMNDREIEWIKGIFGAHARALNRLGTLVHEVIHAYFEQYACQSCMYDTNLDAVGHGRAFQIVASEIERVADNLLGWKPDIGKAASYLSEWEDLELLASEHDLQMWHWERGLDWARELGAPRRP